MTSTFVNDLRLNEMGTGDQSGTWGNVTNTNLELIAEALGFGTEAITTNADTHTTTIADGATDPGRAIYIKYTGTLDSACTITIGPNTISRLHIIENGTSGSQNIIISQGSGANVTIPPGDVKVVYLDGAGSGAAVVDAFASLNVVDLKVEDDLSLTSDSAVLNIGADNDLKITHDGTNGDFESAGNLTFDVAGDIDLDADGGNIKISDGGTQILDIGNSSSDVIIKQTVDAKDLIFQQFDGNEVMRVTDGRKLKFFDDGGESVSSDGSNLKIESGGTTFTVPNSDGSSGQFLKTNGSGTLSFDTVTGTTINNNADNRIITGSGTANTLEGEANLTFDGTNLDMGDSKKIRLGDSQDLNIYHDGTNSYVQDNGTGNLRLWAAEQIEFQDNDAGEHMCKMIKNGAVELYHNNVKKLETTSGGLEVAGTILPSADDTHDLGSSSKQWRDIYTGDINLNNTKTRDNEVDGTRGSWTIQEGEDDLFIINRLNGKKYRFKLEEME
jgi:hypothetical protein